mmetsp:Transcript_18616/g.62855  ORF Transcript_18616/g.62855 Transcript_18616/m.62855 type:complete len:264 (+) Transcript_18616:194-985(+)
MSTRSPSCGLNTTLAHNATCSDGTVKYAFSCTCDEKILCCADTPCADCSSDKKTDELFTFSWPLVMGWYALLVILFCFGRRGRVVSRLCAAVRRRRRNDGRDDSGPDVERGGDDLELVPVVKTRLVVPEDVVGNASPRTAAHNLETEGDDDVLCTICLYPFTVGETVATLDCPHLFHEHCIVPWLRRKSSCPLCMHHIDWELEQPPPPDASAPPRPEADERDIMEMHRDDDEYDDAGPAADGGADGDAADRRRAPSTSRHEPG